MLWHKFSGKFPILNFYSMNDEQSSPEKNSGVEQDTSKVFLADSSLQSKAEFESDKVKDDYYEVDNPKKEAISNIGDGEMRNEGTIGMGEIPEENPFSSEGLTDEQDKAERHDS